MPTRRKLHLGCGKRYLPGYVHIDCDTYDHIDYETTLDDLRVIEDDSVDLIYASHCLEYYDQIEVKTILKEWRRRLVVGGVLRLSVPDLDKLITVYGDTNDVYKIIGPLFGRWTLKNGTNIYHKMVYDKKIMTEILQEAGFTEINEWDWRVELPEDYDDYSKAYFPHMDFDNGICISLNIQAKKTEI